MWRSHEEGGGTALSKKAHHTLNEQLPEDLQSSVWDTSFQGLQVAVVVISISQLSIKDKTFKFHLRVLDKKP